MTSNSPIRSRRGTAGRLLGAAGVAGALAFSAILPAAADPITPFLPGDPDHPSATARIAAVEWCRSGAVGEIGTGPADGSVTADWSADPDHVATVRHFSHRPASAYSTVTRDGDRLTAAAGITDVSFAPDCKPAGRGGDPLGVPLSTAFGGAALVALDSAASSAWWTPSGGLGADIAVEGLEILGAPADLADGRHTDTFTTDLGRGTLSVRVSAERREREPGSGGRGDGPGTASAWLSLRFEVDRLNADGARIDGFDYGVDFTGVSVHTPDTDPSTAGDTPEPPTTGATGPEPTGPPGGGSGGSGGGQQDGSADPASPATDDSPADTGPDPGTPEPDIAPDRSGGEEQSGGGSGSVPADDPVPRPTVSAPVPDLDDIPTGSTDPAGGPPVTSPDGRLPVAGSALAGLIATGLAALGGGGAALYLGRSRKSGLDDDLRHAPRDDRTWRSADPYRDGDWL
ncbi:hypothetical protein LG943_11655 [Streptomonospora sp. S1-112]|uniref:Uncharacterized protein n=1 Tax=Streptomonospora mangrovi TaxID=2883123 RepID=A0A9X3NL37_9ACTN|nr:hypothetical protein [Streptomonospora mangrovi]MDA0564970.1 hypothetical protein [Streptomonospora mangrovi]